MTRHETRSDPLASVVMCAHNEEAYIAEAIESILGQTFAQFELIVIDDASTDRTVEIIRKYDDPRIRLIRNERNLGIAQSRNLGIQAARAPIIVVADADDLCLPARLEEQIRYLGDSPEIGAVGSYINVLDAEGRMLGVIETPVDDSEIKRLMRVRAALVHGGLAVRRERVLSIGGYREKFIAGSDYDLLFRLSEKVRMATIPLALYSYRLTPKSISIRNRGMQKFGISLVKKFAKERSVSGRDSYGEFKANGLAPRAEPQDEDSAYARYHLHAGKLAGRSGNMRLARSHFARSVRRKPFQHEAHLLLMTALGGKRIYKAVQRRFGTSVIEPEESNF